MSNRYVPNQLLNGLDASRYTEAELKALVREILANKIHGLCFSPYAGEQKPGSPITAEQVRQRLGIVAPYTRWVRSFSCTQGNEMIPPIAREFGLGTMVGVWLDDDRERNEIELESALRLAAEGHVDILAVGNEVLLRGELSEAELLAYLQRARQGAPRVDIGYVDAYFKFEDHPAITAACDVVLANCYPYWEYCPNQYALLYMKEMYRRAQRAAAGKKVIISETGWPDTGTPCGAAVPSTGNAIAYFIDTYRWAAQEGLEIFYFSAFDEVWKVADEGDVGAYWGLWDTEGRLKYA